ncbi:hypothetical protein BDZ45DRAFT_680109 [Acephala macrosclerotiorum]|nr:hypothetical protein BDZ45DRAFT_680109 [Acephala macrosclerotiorum]
MTMSMGGSSSCKISVRIQGLRSSSRANNDLRCFRICTLPIHVRNIFYSPSEHLAEPSIGFIARSWHITFYGMFAGSCIGVILLEMALEFLKRASREYDPAILLKAQQ